MALARYALGCPFWNFEGWRGSLYTREARPSERLRQYASVFNAVEGNTTFWSVPSPRSVERWSESVGDGFRFHFKLPRQITHERMLRDAGPPLADFLRVLAPLGGRLGPFLVQLPPAFGPSALPRLEAFLDRLPSEFAWAVELRHRAFFEDEALAARCDALLAARGCDRVVMDTRALRAGDPDHPEVLAALHRKPDLPLRAEPIGGRPVVRFVGHPEPTVNEDYLEEWAARIARWVERGLEPTLFVHTASNHRTPAVARDLHERIAKRTEVGELPAFPGERPERFHGQLELPFRSSVRRVSQRG